MFMHDWWFFSNNCQELTCKKHCSVAASTRFNERYVKKALDYVARCHIWYSSHEYALYLCKQQVSQLVCIVRHGDDTPIFADGLCTIAANVQHQQCSDIKHAASVSACDQIHSAKSEISLLPLRPLHEDIIYTWVKSRKPVRRDPVAVDVSSQWREDTAVGYGDELLIGRRSHNPTSQFQPAPTPVVGHYWTFSRQNGASVALAQRNGGLTDNEMWDCSDIQIISQILLIPTRRLNSTVVDNVYMLQTQTRLLSIGWCYTAHRSIHVRQQVPHKQTPRILSCVLPD